MGQNQEIKDLKYSSHLKWTNLNSPLQLGFYTEPVYFRLEWNGNEIPEELYLENQVAYFDSIKLVQDTAKGQITNFDGDIYPKRLSLFPNHPFPIFRIDTKELKNQKILYIEAHTVSNFLFAPNLWTKEEMIQSVIQTRDHFIVFFSVLFVVFLLNLSIFLSTRNTSFLYYCFYIFCSGMYQISYTGYGKIYFWPNSIQWNDHSLVFSGSIALFSVILFSNRFLLLPKRLPILKIPIFTFSVLIVTNAILSLLIKNIICDQIIHFLAILVSFTLMGAGIFIFLQKYQMAKYYIIAWFCLLFAIVSFNLYAFNLLPDHFILRNAIQYGNFFEIILFQFALFARINETKEIPMFSLNAGKQNISNLRIANLNPEQILNDIEYSLLKENLYLDEDLNLQNVASKFQLRPDQLSAIINQTLGINFNQWINGFRIAKACELMKSNPERNILTVAFEVGFNSKSAFNESFKRIKSVTPTDYRKQLKETGLK
ncbi:helix-turn-helix domain-containing protein [Leptospira kanakyensis]|uniref:Helix-turn-helix domain-containing protein n=2 Tax=Leptospira kanakyensis TaxID=2484968 RepID=A0A6N4QFQ9_9LEPT|nr:helix-turn-helix domain-containing protein [Leptospira kanakyensis]TGK58738.1 helix-turn-helix domain-containing protein [Leptospira kanakyensis]TGK69947.1 helix-turn-helix domain-containing protein [Leptospira kanakyensis]